MQFDKLYLIFSATKEEKILFCSEMKLKLNFINCLLIELKV